MAGVSFVSTALLGTNKVGNLKADSSGYYEVVLGGFETSNMHGHYYSWEDQTKRLFEESSQFMRQIKNGNLFGEYGHPKRQPAENIMDFLKRCILVNEDRQAFHIRKVSINERDVKDSTGKAIVAVLGEVKPMGPYGSYLKEILDTPSANCCFSVRAQTDDKDLPNGKESRSVKQIITWDYVGDPGVATSSKFKSPKLESFYDEFVDYEVLKKLRNEAHSGALKMESASVGRVLDELLRDNRADLKGGTRAGSRFASW